MHAHPVEPKLNLFVTGATGFLGKNILSRIIKLNSFNKIFVLVRSQGRRTAQERLEQLITEILPPDQALKAMERMIAVEGDLTLENLGLSISDYQEFTLNIHQILHIGASTDFGSDIQTARRYNVFGTKQIIKIASIAHRTGRFKRLEYISTAFVAGIKKGYVKETELVRGQDFANSYEQSKWEAECLIHTHAANIPVTVYRPSIVVGDSRHGYTSHFKVLYWPLRILSKNLLPAIPMNPRARLDVVPVDYVSECIVKYMLLDQPPEKILYLTSGKGREVRVSELLRDAHHIAGIKKRPMIPIWIFKVIKDSFIKKFLFSEDFWNTCEMAAPYYYYLKGTGVVFDAQRSKEVIKTLGIKEPEWHDYKRNVLTFCTNTQWGRKISRPTYEYYTTTTPQLP